MKRAMRKQFIIEDLDESRDIQKAYDKQDYFDAVMKCRIYLECWLVEYIFTILYPLDEEVNKANKQIVLKQFNDMFYQIQWLYRGSHISKNDYNNLRKIRSLCDKIFAAGDVFRVVNPTQLNRLIYSAVHYCNKCKNKAMKTISRTIAKQSA
ncbi:MAG: hypothetical protein J7K40_00510 [candidate division Zixibacteria bacterium]|nr:hypothetical protein [candidate division Zixibacteria bacterium]